VVYLGARNLSLDYPLYDIGGRSLKKALLRGATRGNLAIEGTDRITVRALRDINLDIWDGDRVALLGPNGAGKTTLLKVLCGIYEPTVGRVVHSGKISGLLSASLGFDPYATGRENIILRGIHLDIRPSDMRGMVEEIAQFSGLGQYIDMPVRTYSAGMTLRLGFAISTCIEPEILVLDEWLSAGDAEFIERAQHRMERFVRSSRILVLASHSLPLLREWCNRGILLVGGHMVVTADIDEAIEAYEKHLSDLRQTQAAA
jgi:ABC-type polysaccharide/polyol phosphate transport system ATPase subunit